MIETDGEHGESTKLLEAVTSGNGKKAVTVEELRARRTLYATMPSGAVVRIRPPNMELHALSGGLPSRLRHLTGESGAELNRRLSQEAQNEKEDEAALATRDYLVEIVRNTIVEPDLSSLKTFEELDAVMLPIDFHWLLQIGQRETDYDGEGKRLWGTEPLDRWKYFRELHRCDEDCEACGAIRRQFPMAAVQ
jgi:hypothetical protein